MTTFPDFIYQTNVTAAILRNLEETNLTEGFVKPDKTSSKLNLIQSFSNLETHSNG